MEKFIVWDNNDYHKKFINLKQQQIILNLTNGGLKGLYGGDGYMKDWQLFQAVGIQDINEKEIYADCSIVEFEYKALQQKVKGYFKYSNTTLGYHLHLLERFVGRAFRFDYEYMYAFRIIDTIQENKLRLIKE